MPMKRRCSTNRVSDKECDTGFQPVIHAKHRLEACITLLPLRLAAALALALALFTPSAPAQNRPEPGTAVVPEQIDEAPSPEERFEEAEPENRRESPGFVRVWNFAPAASGRLGIFLVDYGKRIPPVAERSWLGRGSRPGETRNYSPFKPGRYELVVIADNSRQGAMAQLPDEADASRDNLLAARQGIEIQGADHHTVIITTSPDGKLLAQVLKDSAVESRRLRCFNFAKDLSPSVRPANPPDAKPLLEALPLGSREIPLPGASAITTFQIALPPDPSGFAESLYAEVDFSGVRSCSLLVFRDRYGRFNVSGKADAPLPPPAGGAPR